jgi:hypothetical protein
MVLLILQVLLLWLLLLVGLGGGGLVSEEPWMYWCGTMDVMVWNASSEGLSRRWC